MYRIESKIVEKLKEQDLNAIDLLQEYVNVRKTEERILYTVKELNEKIKILADAGMTSIEIIQLLVDEGMVVVEND